MQQPRPGASARHYARRQWNTAVRTLRQTNLFPPEIIIHCSYHRCLSHYYMKVLKPLGKEFGFKWQEYNRDYPVFLEAARAKKGKQVMTLHDWSDIEWAMLPSYRGSHFIRDPRDLVVSGYHYHLWTDEEWCNEAPYNWSYLYDQPNFKYVQENPAEYPHTESYREYLRSLDQERGMIVELLWRKPCLDICTGGITKTRK